MQATRSTRRVTLDQGWRLAWRLVSFSEDLVRRARAATSEMGPEPSRHLAVVACMDARVDPASILGAMPGEIHLIRNAGGLVTEDVLRSLLISQHKMNTTGVMVMMHTDCGMLGLDDEAERARIAHQTGSEVPFPLGGFSDLRSRLGKSVERVRSSGYLAHTDAVTGTIYDIAADRLDTVIR